jgi:hypothetical protein
MSPDVSAVSTRDKRRARRFVGRGLLHAYLEKSKAKTLTKVRSFAEWNCNMELVTWRQIRWLHSLRKPHIPSSGSLILPPHILYDATCPSRQGLLSKGSTRPGRAAHAHAYVPSAACRWTAPEYYWALFAFLAAKHGWCHGNTKRPRFPGWLSQTVPILYPSPRLRRSHPLRRRRKEVIGQISEHQPGSENH